MLTFTLYVPGTALLGTCTVATSGTIDPAPTATGLTGVTAQVVPASALTAQVELTLPL
jgi:hypothetical protein